MRDHRYFVYMLASKPYGTLYTGVSNDIIRRVDEHKKSIVRGFTRKYDVKILVWYEMHGVVQEAIAREKKIKRWRRDWKISMIEDGNQGWLDLYPALAGMGPGSPLRGVRDDR